MEKKLKPVLIVLIIVVLIIAIFIGVVYTSGWLEEAFHRGITSHVDSIR